MADELDDLSGVTRDSPIDELGVEARAEYERLRAILGLRAEDESPELVLPAVGRYRLGRELGRGGMGVVYLAHDPEVGRQVAIKLVRGLPFAASKKLSARLRREARVLGKLTHPSIVRIYDAGAHEGEIFLVMEHVDGQTLHEWQRGRPVDEILDAYLQAANGLAAAHDVRIVHRDFKPDNVFVASDGRILVGDFGLADAGGQEWIETDGVGQQLASQVVATKTGALLGTLAYMAPEQLRGDAATPKSDQFAFCVSLWEAIAKERPFQGSDAEELLEAIARGVPSPPKELPARLYRVLRRGLAARPSERHESIQVLIDLLAPLPPKPSPSPRFGLKVLGVLGVLGAWVVISPWFARSVKEAEPCELEQAVTRVASSDAWARLDERLRAEEMDGASAELSTHLDRIAREVSELCEKAPKQEARRQHLRLWVEDLEGFLRSSEGRDPAKLYEDIETMANARLSAPPPRVLDEDVVEALQQSRALERDGDLDGALERAELAVELAGSRTLERSVAEMRHGRVLSLDGSLDLAMRAYARAASAAEAEGHKDARLQIKLLMAKTAVMRKDELGRAEDALADVEGLLASLEEPWLSLRRADHHELRASVLKRSEHYADALTEQWRSLGRRLLLGSVYEVGRGLLNLGTIHERRSEHELDHVLARFYYERAVEILPPHCPDWVQASFDLGHWLITSDNPRDREQARVLLEGVRAESRDLYAPATAALLELALFAEQPSEAHRLALELRAHVHSNPPPSPGDGFDAWQLLAIEAARTGNLFVLDEDVSKIDRFAALIEQAGSETRSSIQARYATIELVLAQELEGSDVERARTLARRAKERIDELPSDLLTKDAQLADVLAAAERILALGPN